MHGQQNIKIRSVCVNDLKNIWTSFTIYGVGRDSAVGIAIRYGLDGPGIESLWGARFSATV